MAGPNSSVSAPAASAATATEIGTNAVETALNIGTGAAARTITIGNDTGATSLVLNCGTGDLNIGTNAIARTITMGNGTGASSLVLDCGTGALNIGTNTAAKTITIGNDASTKVDINALAIELDAGSGGVLLTGLPADTDPAVLDKVFTVLASDITMSNYMGRVLVISDG